MMLAEAATASLKPDWAQIVTWSLVAAGWAVVSWQANRRESRKELRSQLDKVVTDLYLLESRAHEYYALAGSDPLAKPKALLIKRDVRNLMSAFSRLEDRKIGKNTKAQKSVAQLRPVITLGEFESVARVATAADGAKLTEISEAVTDIVDALERDFHANYE